MRASKYCSGSFQVCFSHELTEYKLISSVVSCKEAALAKGIPLKNELKTLILKTSIGFVALQLPGNSQASLRKVKRTLNVKLASLASHEELKSLGLAPGRVSAVLKPTWSMLHLVHETILTLNYISTNSGSLRKYYIFHPSIFLKADKVIVGEFVQNFSNI